MAIKSAAIAERGHGYLIVLWENLTTGDQGEKYHAPSGYHIESINVTGTAGGATVTIEGTNKPDPAAGDFSDITDSNASNSTFIAPLAETLFVRPDVSGGSGTDIDAYALYREGN